MSELQAVKEKVAGLRKLASDEEGQRRTAETELAEARGKISTFDGILELKDNRLKELSDELTLKRGETSEAKAESKRIQDKLEESLSREKDLETRLKDAEREAEEARQTQARAEQRVVDLGDMNRELKERNKALESRERELFDELQKCRQNLLIATEGKADAAARLDERDKKAVSGQKSSATKKADDKPATGGGKK